MTCNNVILAQPNANAQVEYTIPEGDSARLNFGPEDISGLQLGDNGELIVSFENGGTLQITNFAELSDAESLVYLSDGTFIDPSILTTGMQSPAALNKIEAAAGDFDAIDTTIIAQPGPNMTQEISVQSGQKYVCDFDPSQANVEMVDGKMVLTFADGSQVVVNNYSVAMAAELPPEITVAEGVIVGAAELTEVTEATQSLEIAELLAVTEDDVVETASVETVEIIEETLEVAQESIADQVASVEPAAGDDMSDLASQLANIETAAGDEGGAAAGRGGYGYNSSATDVSLSGADAVGALGATQLNYSQPSAQGNDFISPIDDRPDITTDNVTVDDTDLVGDNNVATGSVDVDFGRDGPGTITANGNVSVSTDGVANADLTSGGEEIVITNTADGYVGTVGDETIFTFEINSQTGDFTFTQLGPIDHPDTTDNNEELVIDFGVSATDADGDSSATNVSVTILDDGPEIAISVQGVNEADFHNGETLVVNKTFEHDFGQDGAGAITVNGDTYARVRVGDEKVTLDELTSGGEEVVITQSGNGYVGVAGGVTIFTLSVDAETGEYTYTQFASVDHPGEGQSGTDDVIWLRLGVTITDGDGDTATSYVNIDIRDGAPVAEDDDLGSIDHTDTVDGNVLDNDHGCGDDIVGVTCVIFNGVETEIATGQEVSITGDHGILTINSDGTYSYQATGNTDGGVDTFSYKVVDSDGDTDTADITVEVAPDMAPIEINGVGATDDTNLLDDGMDMVTGNINVNYQGDGPGTTAGNGSFDSAGNQTNGTLTSNGVAIAVTFDAATNTYTGAAGGTTVFTMVINADGTYKFTQLENMDHSNENSNNEALFLDFGVTATDSDGDTGTGTVRITVRDDAPLAAADVTDLDNATNIATGNVLDNDSAGADGHAEICDVSFPGGKSAIALADGSMVVQGEFGTLTVNTDGSYSYERNFEIARGNAIGSEAVKIYSNEGGTDVFEYTIKDSDGDTSTAEITVTVADDFTPIEINGVGATDDTNLLDDGMDMVTGNINVNYQGDGPGTMAGNGLFDSAGNQANGTLTSNGVAIAVTFDAATNTYTGAAGNTTVFTMVINADGTYKFTQLGQVDHSNTNADNEALFLDFGVTATDADGDTGTGTVRITVRDDAPEANDDKADVESGETATGNVLANDDASADDATTVTKVTFEGQDYDVPADGSVTVEGAQGTLTMNSDGSYEYEATGGTETQTVNSFEISDFIGGTGAGKIEQVKGGFNETTEELTFSFTMENADANGATLVLNAGGNPKGHAGELAQFYIDNSGAEPVISVYGYNGLGGVPGTHASAFDGSQEDGVQTPDTIATSLSADSPFTSITVVTNADGSQTFSFSMDATALNDHVPLHGVDGVEWNGVNFGDAVGAWFHPVSGLETDYNADGYLTQFDFDGRSGWDSSNHPTNTTTVSGEDTFTYEITDADGDTDTAVLDVCVEGHVTPTGIYGENETDDTNLNDDGVDAVTGDITVNYNGDDAGSTTGNGQFIAPEQHLVNGGLSHNGVAITVTFDAATNTYTGMAGNTTVFTMVINSDATYEFTQLASIDHANTDARNEQLQLQFGVTATDADGDTGEGVVKIRVRDDYSNAINDNASLDEAGTATGNVIDNDVLSADETSTVTNVSFEGTDYAVPATGTVSVTGEYGVLTLAADGSYTYEANEDADGKDSFVYTLVDGDGDADQATLNLTVNNVNDVPTIEQFNNPYNEADIENGPIVIQETLTHDFGNDGPGEITPNGIANVKHVLGGDNQTLRSNGEDVIITNTADGYVGTTTSGDTVFSLGIDPQTGAYTYTQLQAIDHQADGAGDNTVWIVFGVQIADSDGDTASTYIVIDVSDDEPVAVDDAAILNDMAQSVTGNVLTNDDIGADNGANVMVTTAGTFEGEFGTLVLNMDGSYTYTRNGREGGTDTFDYTMKDSDGDTSSAQLTIGVNEIDLSPIAINGVGATDDTNLNDDGMDMITGNINVNYQGDGPGTTAGNGSFGSAGNQLNGDLTSNGVAVNVSFNANTNTYTGSAGGVTVFTMTINADGTYKFTQLENVDHSNTNSNNEALFLDFGVTATDSDGDTGTGTVRITVRDDAPVAADDQVAIGEEGTMATGNVLANDTVGADDGANVMVTTAGTFEGQYGTLVLNMDGTYKYTRNGREGGTDEFEYTMKDHDGDTDTATLKVVVSGMDDEPTIKISVTGVNEVDLCDHPLVVNKTFEHDFGDDGAGAITVNGDTYARIRVGDDQLLTDLTSDGTPVVITTTANNGYVGTAGGRTIFTLELDSQTGEYTYTQFAGIDHPDADASGTNDVVWLRLGVTITDADGDSADSYVNIDIRDSAPVAVDDKVTVRNTVEVVTSSLDLDASDVNGTQSSFSNDGITITSNTGGDLVWVNHTDGPGVGIAGNGSDKVFRSAEIMQVNFASPVTAAAITLGDMGANNVGNSFEYEVFLSDGTSVVEAVTIEGSGLVGETFEFDVSGYDADIVGVDLIGGPSFLVNNIETTSTVVDLDDAEGNVLTNDHSCGEDATVTSIEFGGVSYDIPANGERTIEGNNGTITIKADGQYSYVANRTVDQKVNSFSIDNPPGSDAAGDIKNVSTSYNETTKEFTFSMTVESSANGIEFAINNGPNPKGHPGELAFFYIDGSGNEPVATVYGYNGSSVHSWRDGSDEAGDQPADKILSSLNNPDAFDNISITTDANGNKVFSITMDVTSIQGHDPAYGPDGIWEGVEFGDKVGIWSHPLSGLETEYGNDGFLTDLSYDNLGWYDSANDDTTSTIIPGHGTGGEDTFTYTITDADGDTDTAQIVVCAHDIDNVIHIDGNGAFEGTQDGDLFFFSAVGEAGAALLTNFDLNEDVLDISSVVEGYDPLTDAINDFVYVGENNGDTIVQIDADGQPGGARENVARLDDVTGQTLEDLLANGTIIV